MQSVEGYLFIHLKKSVFAVNWGDCVMYLLELNFLFQK